MANPKVSVLNVGDGACTVLEPWLEHHPGPSAILDCGVWPSSTLGAAQTLTTHLNGTLAHITAIVVSHFDWDHWGGLTLLTKVANANNDLPQVPLYYPAMPQRLQATVMAMMGPRSGTGSAPLDLQRALAAVNPGNQPPTLHPLNSSMLPIHLAGATFNILWPPPAISSVEFKAIDRAVKEVEDLARDLSEEGHSELDDALTKSTRAALLLSAIEEMPSPSGPALGETDTGILDNEFYPLEVDEDSDMDDQPIENLTLPDGLLGLSIPDDFQDRYKRTLKRIRAANNNLSLVLEAENGVLICFGDISGPALRYLLNNASINKHYLVMLAPHHGTHAFPANMPTAKYCVSQAGRGHTLKWLQKHPQSHGTAKCWNTHIDGDFV